ncbi:LysR family transcriptional regulator [Frankia sp. QA3]|uniref:LysR family transcriptional regulator n=1 Tax=Frankia sp. QA3 TaxID=710111 RepID=UPI000269BFE8|nr:LysR family transcriptional regulator [Frankia sp. QA3]EIV92464.1 transcriptional regulator [Frankia sp. QA3]
MTLEDLRVFVAVCAAGSLASVARDSSRSQSAVSQHVKRLERATGLTLIERQTRGVVPTPAGRLLYLAALSATASLDDALQHLDDLRRGVGGAVRITTGGVTVRHFMAEAVAAFRERYPKVTLEFHAANSTQHCVQILQAGQVDLAWITLGQPLPGIEQRPVIDLPWVLVVRPDDPLAERAVIRPEDLGHISYIAQPENSTSRLRLEESLVRLGISPPAPAGIADWDTALLLAELGTAPAILPALPGPTPLPESRTRMIPIPALTPLAVGWAARSWRALSPYATKFADTVAAALEP